MKKVLFSALVLGAMTLVSCKKEYTCTCTFSGNGISGTASATTKDTKKNAKADCEEGTGTANGVTTTCTLD